MLEHALLYVKNGEEDDFEASMRTALPIIESAPGCGGAEVRRQAENDSIYLLLVRWTSIDAHMTFRQTDLYASWRALTHPFYAQAINATHFHDPLER
ncbi:MAG: antibiotic biosynthesis monooxygenase [Acidimicrobiaceae bacterium]|nr:antibiotic biosynthesis monooxygenase [Acidimicrobiaceae bacterium]